MSSGDTHLLSSLTTTWKPYHLPCSNPFHSPRNVSAYIVRTQAPRSQAAVKCQDYLREHLHSSCIFTTLAPRCLHASSSSTHARGVLVLHNTEATVPATLCNAALDTLILAHLRTLASRSHNLDTLKLATVTPTHSCTPQPRDVRHPYHGQDGVRGSAENTTPHPAASFGPLPGRPLQRGRLGHASGMAVTAVGSCRTLPPHAHTGNPSCEHTTYTAAFTRLPTV